MGGGLVGTMTDAVDASAAIAQAADIRVERAAALVECAAALASTVGTVNLGRAFLGGTMAAAATVRVERVAALADDLVAVGMMGI